MTASARIWRGTALSLTLALTLAAGALPAWSESNSELSDKLERVERDLRDLEYQVYKGNPPASGTGAAMGAGGGQRLNDMEQSLRDLRGQVETLSFQVKQLTEQLDLARRETNYRLGALEGGAPASATTGGPASTALVPAGGAKRMTAPAAPNMSGSNASGQKPGNLGSIPSEAVDEDFDAAASPRQQYDAAMELLTRAQYSEAQAAFRSFVALHPKDDLTGPAQYWVGDIAFTQKDYGTAAKSFADVLRRFPKTPKAPDAMLKLGLSLMELGQKKEACTTLAAVKSKYPTANKAVLDRAARRAAEAKCA